MSYLLIAYTILGIAGIIGYLILVKAMKNSRT